MAIIVGGSKVRDQFGHRAARRVMQLPPGGLGIRIQVGFNVHILRRMSVPNLPVGLGNELGSSGTRQKTASAPNR